MQINADDCLQSPAMWQHFLEEKAAGRVGCNFPDAKRVDDPDRAIWLNNTTLTPAIVNALRTAMADGTVKTAPAVQHITIA